jgi:hypothetical protein
MMYYLHISIYIPSINMLIKLHLHFIALWMARINPHLNHATDRMICQQERSAGVASEGVDALGLGIFPARQQVVCGISAKEIDIRYGL